MSESDTSESERAGIFGRRRPKSAPDGSGPLDHLDPVTGLPQRGVLHEWLKRAERAGRPTSTRAVLAFVGLAGLRDLNDAHGPDAGDDVLREAATRLQGLKLFGARPLHYGATEFAVVFGQVHGSDGPSRIAEEILERLAAPFVVEGLAITIDCHVGVAIGGDAAGGPADLVRDAHQALVQAREGGSGTYVVHDESLRGRYATRIDESRMLSALENEEFLLHYQPIIHTDSEAIFGVEALLRWQEPGATNTGMLFPHQFLPLLEKSGLIVPVSEWVLREACRQAVAWSQAHPATRRISVTCNVSPRQLGVADFASRVECVLSESGLAPEQLCLDLTEQALDRNAAANWSELRHLKEIGVRLGLDDFGRGAASLGALQDLKADFLRIDQRFVDNLAMSSEDQAIVRNMTNLTHELGMRSVAKGVETPEQAAMLITLGVDLGQGYHYGRPDTADKIDTLISTQGA